MMKCPNCGETAMSWYKKAFLGSARTIKCQNCDIPLSVPAAATFIGALPIIIVLVIGSIAGIENTFALVMVGAAFAIPTQIILVPLVIRE